MIFYTGESMRYLSTFLAFFTDQERSLLVISMPSVRDDDGY